MTARDWQIALSVPNVGRRRLAIGSRQPALARAELAPRLPLSRLASDAVSQ